MEQVIIGQYGTPSTSLPAHYIGLSAAYLWSPNEVDVNQIISTAGVIKNLMVSLSVAPDTGKSYAFVLRVNGVSTALTVTISDSDTTGFDSGNEVTVAAGDRVCIMCTPTATPDSTISRHSTVFKGSVAKESLLLGGSYNIMADERTRYSGITGFSWQYEDDARQVIPTAGKIKNLHVRLNAVLTSSDYVFTLRKNGVSTTLTCTVYEDSGEVTASDTTHEVTVAAGDIVTLELANSSSDNRFCFWGSTFIADTDGESVLLCGTNQSPDTAVTYYSDLFNHMNGWGSVESGYRQLAQALKIKKFYIKLATSPGAGKSYTFTVRRSSVDTALNIQVSDADTTGSNLIDTVILYDWDLITMAATPAGTPTSPGGVYWGLVCVATTTVSYPSDPLLRVSGLRRTFWAGLGGQAVYQCELALGGMSITYVSPISSRDIPSAVTPAPTPSGLGYQQSDYQNWLNFYMINDIPYMIKIFGHIPSYEEWLKWKQAPYFPKYF